jgi:hypothetical protein
MSKPRFVISCPFDTYSGYGARSRDIVKAIIELDKYQVELLPQRWGSTSWGFCEDHPEWGFLKKYAINPQELPNKPRPDIWMQITIPNEFQPAGKFNIGCTAGIEATKCQPEWIEGMNRMDINFVSSVFSKSVFQQTVYDKKDEKTNEVIQSLKLEKPIHVVFEGANLDVYKKIPSKEVKNVNLDQIKESFCFLVVGHWMQGEFGHDRKNIGYTIKSFFETFKNKKDAPALILKSSIGLSSYVSREEILKRIMIIKKTMGNAKLPNVYILNGDFTDQEMNELYNHPKVKAMVSLTKGEGYGRPLMEFGLTGKPIMASYWSGHLDFLHTQAHTFISGELENVHPSAANKWLIQDAKWFKPYAHEVGQGWKSLFKKYKQALKSSRKQPQHTKESFSFGAMKELVGVILDEYLPNFPKQVDLKLPSKKISLPTLKKVK